MASMATTLMLFGMLMVAASMLANYGYLDGPLEQYKIALGSLFGVLLAAFGVVGVFFFALGTLYRHMEN